MSLKKSSLAFEREGLQIRIEGLCTYVCPNGHESVPGPVAISLPDTGKETRFFVL